MPQSKQTIIAETKGEKEMKVFQFEPIKIGFTFSRFFLFEVGCPPPPTCPQFNLGFVLLMDLWTETDGEGVIIPIDDTWFLNVTPSRIFISLPACR